jgi:hypothetical protein
MEDKAVRVQAQDRGFSCSYCMFRSPIFPAVKVSAGWLPDLGVVGASVVPPADAA